MRSPRKVKILTSNIFRIMRVRVGKLKHIIVNEASELASPMQRFANEYNFDIDEMVSHIEGFAQAFRAHQEDDFDPMKFVEDCEEALRNAGGVYESMYAVLNPSERNMIKGIVYDVIQNKVLK